MDVLAQLTALGTADLDEAAGRPISMDAQIVPLWKGAQAAGPAFTVDAMGLEFGGLKRAALEAPPGSVLVIAAGGSLRRALFGDRMARLCKLRGLAGAVIDGCARDADGIEASGFPVFCRGLVPTPPFKDRDSAVQRRVVAGGLAVEPGDLIRADRDGIVVIPQEEAAAIVAKAAEMAAGDDAAYAGLVAEAGAA